MEKIELIDGDDQPPQIATEEIEIVESDGAPPPVEIEDEPPRVERVAPTFDDLMRASPPVEDEPAEAVSATANKGEDVERWKYEVAKRDSQIVDLRAEIQKLNADLAAALAGNADLADRARRTEAPWFSAVEKAIASGLALATYPDAWPTARRQSLRAAITRASELDAEAKGQGRAAQIEFSATDVSTLKPTTTPHAKKKRGFFG